MIKTDLFLKSLGWLSGEPTLEAHPLGAGCQITLRTLAGNMK
jgi:hypothetical protein